MDWKKLGNDAFQGFVCGAADTFARQAASLALQALIEKVTNPKNLSQFEQEISSCIYRPDPQAFVG
jgi:hypothetical protein